MLTVQVSRVCIDNIVQRTDVLVEEHGNIKTRYQWFRLATLKKKSLEKHSDK
jgi:hypothetical protein